MSTTMNSRSITDYILKLEKENSELRKVRAVLGDIDSIEESRTKIEQLKKLLTEANEEKVDALNKLNDLEYKSSLYDTTSRVTSKSCTLNQGLVNRMIDLARASNDFYKSATYQKAADVISNLDYEVQTGESLMHLLGIGKGIATKVDEYLDEQDSDYEESECSDSESIASNDEGSFVSDTDASYVSGTEDEEYFVSHNTGLAEMIYEYADRAEDNFKRDAYTKAGDTIYNLSYKITSGKDAMKLRGIGKSIAKKIDDYLNIKKEPSMNEKLATCFLKLGNLEEPVYKSEAYWNAAEKIRDLDYIVMSGDDVRHLRGFGPSICDKIDEYINTGRMLRLEELS
jgi:DNA polymerase/3'-5' exonuclease PolX